MNMSMRSIEVDDESYRDCAIKVHSVSTIITICVHDMSACMSVCAYVCFDLYV